jgi:hypothetical protein
MRPLRNSEGNVAVIFAAVIGAIALSTGAVINFGELRAEAVRLQDAADAAALASAEALSRVDASRSEARRAAADYVRSAIVGGEPVDVQVSVSSEGGRPAVSVDLSRPRRLVFGALFGSPSRVVERGATAVTLDRQPVCLLVLEPDSPRTFQLSGTAELSAPNCVVQVNSGARDPIARTGSAGVTSLASYAVGDGRSISGFSPAVAYDQARVADPFAPRIRWPQPSGCGAVDTVIEKETVTLSPGVYCGGLVARTGADVRLQPGTYVIQSGDFIIENQARLQGRQVTIILLGATAKIDVQSGAVLDLTAPRSGDWSSLTLAVKPQPASVTSTMIGGGDVRLGGAVYLPSQHLVLTGGGGSSGDADTRILVVNRLSLQGNGEVSLRSRSALVATNAEIRLVR